jgi:hypothetical protein
MHLIENAMTGEATLYYLTDKKTGEPLYEINCKVKCGACCNLWYQIKDLQHLLTRDTPKNQKCPMLRTNGCKLKRNRMPEPCRAYLCELGMLAHENQVTEQEIQHVIMVGAQEWAIKELKKRIQVDNNSIDYEDLCPELRKYKDLSSLK